MAKISHFAAPGAIGAVISGVSVAMTNRMEETGKIMIAVAAIAGILISEFMRKSGQKVAIALLCGL